MGFIVYNVNEIFVQYFVQMVFVEFGVVQGNKFFKVGELKVVDVGGKNVFLGVMNCFVVVFFFGVIEFIQGVDDDEDMS